MEWFWRDRTIAREWASTDWTALGQLAFGLSCMTVVAYLILKDLP